MTDDLEAYRHALSRLTTARRNARKSKATQIAANVDLIDYKPFVVKTACTAADIAAEQKELHLRNREVWDE